MDVAEDEEAVTLTAELPGVKESDIEVSLVGDQLTIKGEKRSEAHQIMLAQIGAHRRKPESLALPSSLREANH